MAKKNNKVPVSFSLSKKIKDNIDYYRNTHFGHNLSRDVELFLMTFLPDMSKSK